MRPAFAAVIPTGVRPKVSVGNNGLTPVLPPSPDATVFAAAPELTPKTEGVDAVAAGAVVGSGNCPQLVVRVAASRDETGGTARVEVAAVGLAAVERAVATPAAPVNGGTENEGGPATVVDGNVVPFVAPNAEAAGLMGRPARSTFCVNVCPASANEGGTDGKLNPEPVALELSGFRTVITRELPAACKTQPAESLTSAGMATGDESSACCNCLAFALAVLVVSRTLVLPTTVTSETG